MTEKRFCTGVRDCGMCTGIFGYCAFSFILIVLACFSPVSLYAAPVEVVFPVEVAPPINPAPPTIVVPGSEGPLYAGSVVSEPGTGLSPEVPWTNPGSATVSDDDWAFAVFTSGGTEYLKATDFGFAIPPEATITSIQVFFEKFNYFGSATGDTSVKIVKGGAITGVDQRNFTGNLFVDRWPINELPATVYYGLDWGETWTPADINSPDFGAAIAAGPLTSGTSIALVDSISITVVYQIVVAPPPPPLPPPPPPPRVPVGTRWTLGALALVLILAGLVKVTRRHM